MTQVVRIDPYRTTMTPQDPTDAPPLRDRALVHVVRQYKPSVGGLEDFVASLAAQQRGRFKRIRVVTCDRVFRGDGAKLPKREILDGIEVVRLPYVGSPRYPVTPGILSAIRDADLVHVHAVDFFFDALAATRWLHRKPLIATTHGGFFHSPAYRRIKQVWFATLTRASAAGYRVLACCSRSDFERFRTIAPARARLIENGVDIGKLADAGAKDPVKGLVTVGRLAQNKRVDRLLDALAVLVREDPAWHLDIIGTPFDWSAEEVAAMIAERGLGDHARLHVGPSDGEMREIVGRASLFVSASVYEGFGIALIEAMSAGLAPVVEGNAAFTAFADTHDGIAVTDFVQAETAARAISETFARLSQGDVARWRAEAMAVAEGYSWPATAARYEALYREALAV